MRDAPKNHGLPLNLVAGGRGGIRTHGEFNPTLDFESSALNRTQPPFLASATIKDRRGFAMAGDWRNLCLTTNEPTRSGTKKNPEAQMANRTPVPRLSRATAEFFQRDPEQIHYPGNEKQRSSTPQQQPAKNNPDSSPIANAPTQPSRQRAL
jgi:hypothetical protein